MEYFLTAHPSRQGYSAVVKGLGERVLPFVESPVLRLLLIWSGGFSLNMQAMKCIEDFADYLFLRRRWVIHIFFWLLILIFYAVFFGRKNNNYLQTFFFVGLLMPVTVGTTYFLNYFLVPRYLMREKYGAFFMYFIYTLIGSIFIEMMIAVLTLLMMAGARIKNMSPASIDLVFLLTSLLMVVFLGVAIKMLLYWRKSKEEYERLMRDKVEAELKFLKVQLNPHFLFNTLNNLYYLSTEKSDKAPQAILQLSEILDYVLNQGKSVFVSLEDELRQVDNYISLELLRYADRVKIEKNIMGDLQGHNIGPMFLITLIENSFKHGVMNSASASWIKLAVECLPDKTMITVSNSATRKQPGNGIGLENLRSQLQHLYPGKHTLKAGSEGTDGFSVTLILEK